MSYDELPLAVRLTLSREQWQWLTDAQRAAYVGEVCEPETFEDGA